MSSHNSLIIYALLTFFVFKEVSCTSKDVVRIVVSQCNGCASSSYNFTTIGENSTTHIIRMPVPSNSYFFVVQVHHYLDAVRLSYAAEPTSQNSVYGTNIGLNQFTHDKLNHTFYLFNNFTSSREVLIAVTSYSKTAPMPGGCNMEFNTDIAPYQHVKYDDALITVDVQSASMYQRQCELQGNITLDFYQMFIDNSDVPLNASYNAIIQMLTVDSIKEHGHMVIKPEGSPMLRRFFNNYQGFGVVYVVIASYGDKSAAYVPSFTYGCNMHNGTKSCFDKDKITDWTTMSASTSVSLFLLFTSYTAHVVPFFNIGYYGTNAFLTFIGLPYSPFIYITIGIAAILAFILGGLSKFFEFEKIILRLYAANILTSVIYFGTATGDYELCQTVGYFWILYVSLLIAMMVPVLDTIAKCINISFHTALMVDALVGNGRLMYFNINAVRRASVSNFYLASLYAPHTSVFAIGCIVLIAVLFAIGKCIRNRNTAGSIISESTPLLM